ncbi:hypothetical protein OKA05_20795 [Luteolibacter arcticus]|uniref:Uncharacterized protein n=1 Tax=Luteolibacter arcticus TaxID=1581411 RepID=A0ABT3GNC3_9BACT|nr:hypothetical protein [Luteolibacter arcticus]MCW1925013.1 hypothetical protein [Luteolibacter arcticus]
MAHRVGEALARRQWEDDRWHGFTLKAVEGSTVNLADTEDNQKAFPQPPGLYGVFMGFAG